MIDCRSCEMEKWEDRLSEFICLSHSSSSTSATPGVATWRQSMDMLHALVERWVGARMARYNANGNGEDALTAKDSAVYLLRAVWRTTQVVIVFIFYLTIEVDRLSSVSEIVVWLRETSPSHNFTLVKVLSICLGQFPSSVCSVVRIFLYSTVLQGIASQVNRNDCSS